MTDRSHRHNFVETYDGVAAFGLGRKPNEETIQFLLQKFTDDAVLSALIPRMTDQELEELHDQIYIYLKRHLSEDEYHNLFLKDDHHH